MRVEVIHTERRPSSSMGNPRWRFSCSDGSTLTTAPNIGDAYKISPGFSGPLDVEVDSRGRVVKLDPA